MITIEDESHAETLGQYPNFQAALIELKRLAKIPWDKEPNLAPCTNWKTCGRMYEIIEREDSLSHWKEVRRIPALEVSALGIKWLTEFKENDI